MSPDVGNQDGVLAHQHHNKRSQLPPLHRVVVNAEDEKYYNEELLNLTNGLIECFEVVVDDVKKGKVRVYHRIVSLRLSQKEDNISKGEEKQEQEEKREEEEEEDDQFDEEGLGDSILDTLLFSCVGCEPIRKPVKSILKKQQSLNTINEKDEVGGIPAITQSMSNRNVSFSSIEIKEFKMTLGDHPSATSGPPVRLDWHSPPTFERTISLDEYEQMRVPRRHRKQLKLSYKDRNVMLLKEQGFTQYEINHAWAEALKIRHQRHETIQRGVSSYQISMDDLMESLQRKCKRVTDTVAAVVPNNVSLIA